MIPTNPEAISFAEIFLSIGISTTGLGIWLRKREFAPKHWPNIYGLITNIKIDEQATGSIYASKIYVPIIEYEYQYNGQAFKSARRRANNYSIGNKHSAEEVSSRYSVGKSVKVFINPKKPAVSALEYGATSLSWVLIGLGIILTGFGILPFFFK
jgi:hypothetical protein